MTHNCRPLTSILPGIHDRTSLKYMDQFVLPSLSLSSVKREFDQATPDNTLSYSQAMDVAHSCVWGLVVAIPQSVIDCVTSL